MALFKILKGPEKKDSTGKSVMLNPVASGLAIKEGWAYVTDAGNFYVDISDTTRVKINQNADFSVKAENDSSNQKITGTYIKDVRLVSGANPSYEFIRGDNTTFSISIPTALSGFTANRLIYSSSATAISSTSHYADTTSVAINSTSAPTGAYKLYVNGGTNLNNSFFIEPNIVANSTTPVDITATNVSTYFTVTNDPTHSFINPGSYTDSTGAVVTLNGWAPTNITNTNTTAKTTFKAKNNCILTLNMNFNKYSSDYFYIDQNGTRVYSNTSSGVNTTASITLKVQTNDTLQFTFVRSTNTSTTYIHYAYFNISYQAATLSKWSRSVDPLAVTNTTDSTSTTTGAVQIAGGLGVAGTSSLNNLNVYGITDLKGTNTFSYDTQWINLQTAVNIDLNNISTYFTVTNDANYYFINPGSYTDSTGAVVTLNGWAPNNINNINTVAKTILKAKNDCVLTFNLTYSKYS